MQQQMVEFAQSTLVHDLVHDVQDLFFLHLSTPIKKTVKILKAPSYALSLI